MAYCECTWLSEARRPQAGERTFRQDGSPSLGQYISVGHRAVLVCKGKYDPGPALIQLSKYTAYMYLPPAARPLVHSLIHSVHMYEISTACQVLYLNAHT